MCSEKVRENAEWAVGMEPLVDAQLAAFEPVLVRQREHDEMVERRRRDLAYCR